MRITHAAQYNTMRKNIERVDNTIAKLRNQGTTGLKLNKASDDPTIVGAVLDTRNQIQNSERFENSLNLAGDAIDVADTQLDTIGNTLTRANEIALAGNSGSASEADLETYAGEVDHLIDQLVSVGNTRVSGNYIFGGYENQQPPFIKNENYDPASFDENDTSTWPVTYQGDNKVTNLEIAPGEMMESGVTGSELFMGVANETFETDPTTPSGGGVNIFNALAKLQKGLTGADTKLVEDSITHINTAAEQNRGVRADMGVKAKHIENSIEKQQEAQIDLQKILSRYQSADAIAVYSKLTQSETSYQAALSITGRISSISILDYM